MNQRSPSVKEDIQKKGKVKRGSRDHKKFLRKILKDLEEITKILE